MKDLFNNKYTKANKNIFQSIDEFFKRISNLIAIAGSIFAIFVLLMQVRQVNIDNFYISHYLSLIHI